MNAPSKSFTAENASQSQHTLSSDYRPPIPPQEYAARVWEYSELGAESSLYPGPDYQRLAGYLRSQSRTGQAAPSSKSQPFAFLQLYPSATNDPNNRIGESAPSKVSEDPIYPSQSFSEGQLLFMRGQPSSEWLRQIGGTFRVDPEFFHRHLDFFSAAERRDHYGLPSLPSSSNYIIQLRYFTICKPEKPDISAEETSIKRAKSKKLMEKYTSKLITNIDADDGTGSSIVRDFYVFNHDYLVIEQSMSLCVTRVQGGWTGIAWIDTGKNLLDGPVGPWTDRLLPLAKSHDRRAFLPTIQTRPGAGLRSRLHMIPKSQRPTPNLAQSSALLHLDYGRTLDKGLMSADAFYAFQELFSFCAFSHNQILNMIERDVLQDSDSENPKDLSLDQSNYIYIQEFLERQINQLRENVEAIRTRGGPMWPRPDDDAQTERCVEAAYVLEKDYEALVGRANRLSERCKSKIGHLATRALLAESKRAIQQSEEVTNLTRLAFVFIPLSFTASFFGMNLDPIVSGTNPLWVWFAVSVPLVFVSMILMKWKLTYIVGKIMKILDITSGREEGKES